ncbi:hypothetical protein ANCDUO_05695 [Ancylostoma duodenale]|uniref:Uncharacterized protein n=1 Tax=Ancylostoma duodenale TaxID=51022 RepID=A0A0C2D3H8_9BILA|nr:hypothetical protein ANCDUO_05695 [Ancylostoma duodenale]
MWILEGLLDLERPKIAEAPVWAADSKRTLWTYGRARTTSGGFSTAAIVRAAKSNFYHVLAELNNCVIKGNNHGSVFPAPIASVIVVGGQAPSISHMLALTAPQDQKQLLGERSYARLTDCTSVAKTPARSQE